MTESVYEFTHNVIELEQNTNAMDGRSPLTSFLYALKSSEAKRSYPARLKKFFNYLEIKINSTTVLKSREELNKQSIIFVETAIRNENWVLNSILFSPLWII